MQGILFSKISIVHKSKMYLLQQEKKKVLNIKQSLEIHSNHCLSHLFDRIFKDIKVQGYFFLNFTLILAVLILSFFIFLSLSIESTNNKFFRIKTF